MQGDNNVIMEKSRIKINKNIYICILIVIVGIMTFLTVPVDDFKRDNIFVIATFILNGLVWITLLIKEIRRYSYSLLMMHWFFCLLFFFYAPLIQYANDSFPWINDRSDEVLLQTNLILLIWSVSVVLGKKFTVRWKRKTTTKENKICFWDNTDEKMMIITIINIIIMLYRVMTVGPQNLLSRASSRMVLSDSSSLNMLIGHSMEALSYFAAAHSLINWKKNHGEIKSAFIVVINLICLLVSYFPTGMARYAMAAVYGGLLLVFSNMLKKERLFPQLFLIAYLIVFPFLNSFRNVVFSDVNLLGALQNTTANLSDVWLAGDYDAYTMMTMAIDYVQEQGITWGAQLSGSILFWVPRSLWSSKPVGSGYMMAAAKGWSFRNLSCPLPAEMYLNFGLIGIVVMGAIIGKILVSYDTKYWEDIDISGRRPRYIDSLYPCMVFFFFFMCRGDLMSSTAYVMAYVIMWFFLCAIYKIRVVHGKLII